jgi:hypothetical protein
MIGMYGIVLRSCCFLLRSTLNLIFGEKIWLSTIRVAFKVSELVYCVVSRISLFRELIMTLHVATAAAAAAAAAATTTT